MSSVGRAPVPVVPAPGHCPRAPGRVPRATCLASKGNVLRPEAVRCFPGLLASAVPPGTQSRGPWAPGWPVVLEEHLGPAAAPPWEEPEPHRPGAQGLGGKRAQEEATNERIRLCIFFAITEDPLGYSGHSGQFYKAGSKEGCIREEAFIVLKNKIEGKDGNKKFTFKAGVCAGEAGFASWTLPLPGCVTLGSSPALSVLESHSLHPSSGWGRETLSLGGVENAGHEAARAW